MNKNVFIMSRNEFENENIYIEVRECAFLKLLLLLYKNQLAPAPDSAPIRTREKGLNVYLHKRNI